jgi:simple sugar transport system permease protein
MKMHDKTIKEPLFHIVKRHDISLPKAMIVRVLAVVIALLFCSLLSIFLIEANPLKFISTLFEGVFGTPHRMWTFAKDLCVLLCIALAITPAFRMRFWNIGAEGQTLISALAAVGVAVYVNTAVPNWLLLVFMFAASVIAGALWGAFPAIFKAKWNTNETLFTLMMNYVASGLVAYFLLLWTPSGSSVLGELSVGHLPVLGHKNLLLILAVLLLTVLVYIYLRYTKQGYEISVVGESENTARYIGIDVKKVIIRTVIISGALCGVMGWILAAGTAHSITANSVGGNGFTAIMISWMSKFNPVIMVFSSLLVCFLQKGAGQIASNLNLNSSVGEVLTGIIILFIIGSEFFTTYKIHFLKKKKGGFNHGKR